MTKLKVYCGLVFYQGKQVESIIAATSQKGAAEAVGTTLSYFRTYWTETGNQKQLAAALAKPGIQLYSKSGEYVEILDLIDTLRP